MKKLLLAVLCVGFLGLAGIASAEQKAKATIAHCGCDFESEDGGLVWHIINVNGNAIGHTKHGEMATCFYDSEDTVDAELYVRLPDCEFKGDGEGVFVEMVGCELLEFEVVDGASCEAALP